MARLFKRGKKNKEEGLMNLQRKQWAAEYNKLHEQRRGLEGQVEEALKGIVGMLSTTTTTTTSSTTAPTTLSIKNDGGGNSSNSIVANNTNNNDNEKSLHLTTLLAASSLLDEFVNDSKVTNTIAQRMLSEIFNLRAAVVAVRSKGARRRELTDAIEQLEEEEEEASNGNGHGGGSGHGSTSGGGRGSGGGASSARVGGRAGMGVGSVTTPAPPRVVRSSGGGGASSSLFAARSVSNNRQALAGGMSASPPSLTIRAASSSSLATVGVGMGMGAASSARGLPPSASSFEAGGGGGGGGVGGAANNNNTNTNRHRSSTMTSPDEANEERRALKFQHQKELSTITSEYTRDCEKVSSALSNLQRLLRDEMDEWNDATNGEKKLKFAMRDQLGKLLKGCEEELVSAIIVASRRKRKNENEEKKNEASGEEEEKAKEDAHHTEEAEEEAAAAISAALVDSIRMEARSELYRLLTSVGVEPTAVLAMETETTTPSATMGVVVGGDDEKQEEHQQREEQEKEEGDGSSSQHNTTSTRNPPPAPKSIAGFTTAASSSSKMTSLTTSTTATSKLVATATSVTLTLDNLEESVDREVGMLRARYGGGEGGDEENGDDDAAAVNDANAKEAASASASDNNNNTTNNGAEKEAAFSSPTTTTAPATTNNSNSTPTTTAASNNNRNDIDAMESIEISTKKALNAVQKHLKHSTSELIGLFRAALMEKLAMARMEALEAQGGKLGGADGDEDEENPYADDVFEDYEGDGDDDGTQSTTNKSNRSTAAKSTRTAATTVAKKKTTQEGGGNGAPTFLTNQNQQQHHDNADVVSLSSTLSGKRLKGVDVAIVAKIRETIIPQFTSSVGGGGGGKTASSSFATTSAVYGVAGKVASSSSSSAAGGGVSSLYLDRASNKMKELLHHRIKLEFPHLTPSQIVSICRSIALEEKQTSRLKVIIKKGSNDVSHLLTQLKEALVAEEAAAMSERERIAWLAMEAEKKANSMRELQHLRAIKQEKDAQLLEKQMAEEEARSVEEEKKNAIRKAEYDERLKKLAIYQQEKQQLEEREAALKKEEEAILAKEQHERGLYNKTRVAARDKQTQDKLDNLRLERLEIEQEKAEKAAKMERFFEKVEQRIGVERDPQRVIQLTEAKKNVVGKELLVNQSAAAAAFNLAGRGGGKTQTSRHGFSDDAIIKDPRYRIHQALLSAGLQHTQYARTLVERGCGYALARHNAMSEGPGAFW